MPSSAAFRGLVTQLFSADFPAAQSAWVEEFLLLLVELRHAFGNDIDKVIILSLIGQQFLRTPALPAIPQAATQTGQPPDPARRSTNIDALVRASRIPRESVRRKVNELIADALVERLENGGLAIRAGASARLAPATLVSIGMLDAVFSVYMGRMCDLGLLSAKATPKARSTPTDS
ncbi:MAG: hypothetical protein ACRCUI_11440 [Polymorphobacter sp.]